MEWTAQVGNWASRRAAEKAGFRVEGVRRGLLQTPSGCADAWSGAVLPDDPLEDTAALPPYEEQSDAVVSIRRWRPSDAPDVARACDDAETARWLPWTARCSARSG